MKEYILLSPTKVGSIELKNRIVMAPMTRSRAIGNIPNQLMNTYYEQRSGAGFIVTEGTSPSPNGLGYPRIPGIFSKEQVEGWKLTTSGVHQKGGKIVIQLMHTGRISHPLNLPEGAHVVAPSAIKAAGQMYTDQKGMQDYPIPLAMTSEDILKTKSEYITAAKLAMQAGFDGVELHGANGYLLEQFLSPFSNKRDDSYGGSLENRCRFVLEVTAAVAEAIGKEKTGIRLSPFGVMNDMPHYPEIEATYKYLAEQLNSLGIAYVHILDHSASGAPPVPVEIKKLIRATFKNSVILCGGYDKEKAETDIQCGLADLVAFGRPFINNPDLPVRFEKNLPMSTTLLMDLFYSPGAKGYSDYPAYQGEGVPADK
jgi:N-ethylmaleimide reductase